MAKAPDERNPKRKPEDAETPSSDDIEIVEEVDEVSAEDAAAKEFAAMPNLSLDEAHPPAGEDNESDVVEVVEVADDDSAVVLEDEPPVVHPVSDSSSVVEVAEVVEESSHVLSEQPVEEAGTSVVPDSAIEVDSGGSSAVLAEEVKEESSVVPDSAIEVDSGSSSVIVAEEATSGSSVVSASAIEIESADVPSGVVEVSSDVVEASPASDVFGMDDVEAVAEPAEAPDVMAEASPVPEAHDEGVPDFLVPHADTHADDQATEEIDWNDITALGDSKVAKKPDDVDETIAFAGAPDSGVKESDDGDTIAEEVSFDALDSDEGQAPSEHEGIAAREEEPEDNSLEETDLDGKAAAASEDILFDDDDEETPRKDAAHVTAEDEDMAAQALLEDVDSSVADKDILGAESAKNADDLAEVLPDEEEAPVVKKKKGKQKGRDEDDEFALAGAGKRDKGAPQPRRGRGWLAGALVTTLLLGGAAAGVWYAKPDLLEQAYKSAPGYVAPKKEKARVDPPHVLARAMMDNKDFARAVQVLDSAVSTDKSPANLSTRAEARWLQYLQKQAAAKKPLDPNAAEIKQVLADLKEAGNDLLTTQVVSALEGGKLRAELDANQKTLADLKDMAEKARLAKEEADKQLAGITEILAKDKVLGKDKLEPAALQNVLKDLGEAKSSLAAVNKMLEDAKIDEPGDKGVSKLASAKKEAADKLEAVNKLLADDKVNAAGAQGVEEVIAARARLAKERTELDQALKSAYQELSGGGQPPASDEELRAKLLEAARAARTKGDSPLAVSVTQLAGALGGLGSGAARIFEKGFDTAALAAEVAFYRMREPFILAPDRRLDDYITQFQSTGHGDAVQLRQAAKESAWVLSKEARSTPEARAKALYVAALADRGKGDFEASRKNLILAIKIGAAEGASAPWLKQAAVSLKELTDPAAYYLPRAEALAARGDMSSARQMLDLGLKVFPNDAGLLALRALVRLESVRGNNRLLETAQKDIRRDAEAAAKNATAAPEAAFVLGLLEEELGNLDKAETELRKAIKSHRGNPDEASRYIGALARLLQRERLGSALPAVPLTAETPELKKDEPEPKKADTKKDDIEPKKADEIPPPKESAPAAKKDEPDPKKADTKNDDAEPKKADDAPPQKEPDPKKDEARSELIRGLLTYALMGVQLPAADEEDPATAARIQESIELAKTLIQSTNPKTRGEGYMILGQALSKQGRRTDGVKEYIKGLELLLPGAPSKDLAKLLVEHPAFQGQDTVTANPVAAEQFFGKGLHLFFARSYPAAEAEFRKAIQFYNQDARYQYYLGMSLLAQKGNVKRDAAYYAFEQGARLEAANRPSLSDVNYSLERIQGPLRMFVDSFRQKAVATRN